MYNEKSDVKHQKVHAKLPDFDLENSQTFFDIEIGNSGDEDKETGRIVFEVFTK